MTIQFFFKQIICIFSSSKRDFPMSKIARILQYTLIFIFILLAGGCASSTKRTWEQKRRTAARTNTASVGRNKFFYSTNYQKKLSKSYRNKR